jgi:hypothetical protein
MGISKDYISCPATELYVKLKYNIITRDISTWDLCKTYPIEVLKKWAWRCANDVEHLADSNSAAKETIALAKLYKNGLISKDRLNGSMSATNKTLTTHNANAINAAYAAVYAAKCSVHTYCAAPYSAYYASTHAPTHTVKFTMFIQWLIEELVIWELTQNN